MLLVVRHIAHRSHQKQLDVPFDRGHRRAQLVRNGRNQLCLGPLGLHLGGDIPEDRDRAQKLVAHHDRRQMYADDAILDIQPGSQIVLRGIGPGLFRPSGDRLHPGPRLAAIESEHFPSRPPQRLVPRQLQKTLRSRIEQNDRPHGIGHDHAIGNGLQYRLTLGRLDLPVLEHSSQPSGLIPNQAIQFSVVNGVGDLNGCGLHQDQMILAKVVGMGME